MLIGSKWFKILGVSVFLSSVACIADGDLSDQVKVLEQKVTSLSKQLVALKKQIVREKRKHVRAKSSKRVVDFTSYRGKKNFQASAVTTSPTLGLNSAFDGSDLQIAMSSMNQDLSILKRRKKFELQRIRLKAPMTRPQIELSGLAIGGVSLKKPDDSWTQDIDLNGFEVDVLAEIDRWIHAYGTVEYDNGATDDLTRLNNSRLHIGRAFITLGDLTQSPFYSTVGQFIVPFGRYSTATITSPMTKSLGKIKARGVILGRYQEQGPKSTLLQAYLGQGPTSTSDNASQINYWGLNAVWKGDLSNSLGVEAGLGWTSNMLNGGVFQDWISGNGADPKALKKIYPGIDAYTRLTFDPVQLNLEYVSAKEEMVISPIDGSSFNKKPRALYGELRYNTKRSYPGVLALGYSRTWDTDDLQLPTKSLFVADNMNLWRSTLQTLEYRKDQTIASDGSKTDSQSVNFRFWVFF